MNRYRLRILGNPVLVSATDGADVLVRPGKPLALLIYLAVRDGPVSRDELAELLWPAADRRHSRASLRQALWTLRQDLGEEIFASEDPVALSATRVSTDLESFRAALRRGDISTASELWTGPPLQELEFPGMRGWAWWAEELQTRAGASHYFPGGYRRAAKILRRGHTVYRWKFVKPGEKLGMAFDGLVYLNGRWLFFPKPWRILQKR